MTSCQRTQKSTSSSVPRFYENLRDVHIREGEAGSLECRVSGFPRPEVKWERNGRMLHKCRNFHLDRIGDRCVLRIKSCTLKDEGLYSCIASNIIGTATSRGILHVLSGFKDNSRCCSETTYSAPSEKRISTEKKGFSGITNSRLTEKPFDAEKHMKAAMLVKKNDIPKSKNTNSNRLSSFHKENVFPGNLLSNQIKEMPKKVITKSVVDRVTRDAASFRSLKSSETLRSNHLKQSESAKLTRVSACESDSRSVPHGKLTTGLKRSYAMKAEQMVGDSRKTVTNKKDVLKEKKGDEKKQIVKNKPIMRDKKNESQLKVNGYQNFTVLADERRKAFGLIKQKHLEEEDSFEQKSRLRVRCFYRPSASDTKNSNGNQALKVTDIGKKSKITEVSRTTTCTTNDPCEANKKRTDFNFKVNTSKKKAVENISGKNRTVPEFGSRRRTGFQSCVNEVSKSAKSIQDSRMSSKRRDESIIEKNLSDENRKTIISSNFCTEGPRASDRSVPLKNCTFSASMQVDSREPTILTRDKLKKVNEPKLFVKQEMNHSASKKLNDCNENSKNASYLEPPVDADFANENQTNDVQSRRGIFPDISHDCNVCQCSHKDTDTNPEKENSVSCKIRNNDGCNKTVKSFDDMRDKRKSSTVLIHEVQNHSTKDANKNGWQQNEEHTKISPALHDTHDFSNSDRLPFGQNINTQVRLNRAATNTGKLPKDVAEIEKYSGSRNMKGKMPRTKVTKNEVSSRTTFSDHSTSVVGPLHCDTVFHKETAFKPGENVVRHLNQELCAEDENNTLAKINPDVASYQKSSTKREKEDSDHLVAETKPSDVSVRPNDVKNLDRLRTQGYENRDISNTRTCKGNVRLNSDVIEEASEYFLPKIPEAEAEEDMQQVESQGEFPVRIVKGPQSVTVLRGESVTLAVHFQGTPQPTVTWAKAGTTLRSDGRMSILVGRDMSVLTVSDVTADDSGKYVVSVENSGGGDSCFASMAVVGIPEPPGGQPTASDVTDHSLVLSWYGSMYDGGSVVTGYVIEMSTLPERRWHRVSSCVNTSNFVQGLSNGQHYVFRIRAENRYGLSQPSRESETICLENSSSCEDWEVSRTPVKVEAGSLFSEQFELKEEVGKGRFGTVYRCIEKTSGRPRAAKIIRCIKAKDKETVQREITVMNKLHHPKLMQILAAFQSGKNMIMVMEFISGGELFERVIADDFILTENDCVLFMRQICDGVAYMHKCCVLHLDLKPENILCKTRTCHQIKIIDFGLARVYNPDENLRVLFGTPEFVAPEVINYEPVGPPSDMWSVGVICYVLLSGLSPFMGESDAETFANITRGEMDFDDEAFDTISENAKNFISLLLVKKQKDRMAAEECLKHCWLASADWNASDVPLSTEKLKRFIVRRKWQKTGTAIRALGRMVSLSRTSLGSSSGTPSPLGSPKIFRSQSEISRSETSESGFSEIFSDTNSLSDLIS